MRLTFAVLASVLAFAAPAGAAPGWVNVGDAGGAAVRDALFAPDNHASVLADAGDTWLTLTQRPPGAGNVLVGAGDGANRTSVFHNVVGLGRAADGGTYLVMWAPHGSELAEQRKAPGGSWLPYDDRVVIGTARTASPEETSFEALDDGRAILATTRDRPPEGDTPASAVVEVRARSTNGVWSDPTVLATATDSHLSTVSADLAPNGAATVTWWNHRIEDPVFSAVRQSTRLAGSTEWSSPQTIETSTATRYPARPRVALDDTGAAVLIYRYDRWETDANGHPVCGTLLTRDRPAGSTDFGEPTQLVKARPDAIGNCQVGDQTRLTVSPDGRATAGVEAPNGAALFSQRRPGGQWEEELALPLSHGGAGDLRLTDSPDGSVLVSYHRGTEQGETFVQYAHRRPGGGWQLFSEPFSGAERFAALDRNGTPWIAEGGTVRVFDDTPPAVGEITGVPDGAVPAGHELTLGISATDDYSQVGGYAWTFSRPGAQSVVASGPQPEVVLPSPGTWTATAIVNDHLGNAIERTKQITVAALGQAVTVTPPTLTFATHEVGETSASQSMTLKNVSGVTLDVGEVLFDGPFHATGTDAENCLPPLDPQASCAIRVRFAPTVNGPIEGALRFLLADGRELGRVALAGTGTGGPKASFNTDALEFGFAEIGKASPAKQLVLTNSGNAPMHVTKVEAGVPFSASGCVGTLSAKASCTIDVTIAPGAQGPTSGLVRVFADVPDGVANVAAKGTGVNPGATSDTEVPNIEINRPQNGQQVAFQGDPIKVEFSCSEARAGDSGVKSCRGYDGGIDKASGDPLFTAAIGGRTFKVVAEDWAGHETTKTVNWEVLAPPAPPPPPTPPVVHQIPNGVPPKAVSKPRITGTIEMGQTVGVQPGTWSGTAPIDIPVDAYQWFMCTKTQCIRIGTGSSLTLPEESYPYKITVVVHAKNLYSAQWATSEADRVDVPVGTRDDRRRGVIAGAYQQAYGREPTDKELERWLKNKDSHSEIVESLRRAIAGNKSLSKGTVRRAWEKVYGHGPYNGENVGNDPGVAEQSRQYLEDWVSQRDRPKTFSALIDALARELAVQAYDKIFFWEGGPNGTKARLDEIVQRMREGDFHQPFDSHGSSGEQLWTAVAWSNKALHGAARTWYGDGRDPRAAIREGCFGAIGSGCKGAVDFPTKDGDFTTKDGRRMNYIKLKTAIGSIAHDAQCRNIADGQWCRQDLGERFKSEDPFAKHSMGASREWDKAVTNTFTRRIWDEHYGPYPTRQTDLLLEGKSGDDITYSDDLRWHGSGRRTEVSFGAPDTRGVLVAGLKDGPGAALVKGFAEALARAEREPWHGEEIKATTRLWAPKGTNLDESDAVWCRSKKFARTNVSLWQGTCG